MFDAMMAVLAGLGVIIETMITTSTTYVYASSSKIRNTAVILTVAYFRAQGYKVHTKPNRNHATGQFYTDVYAYGYMTEGLNSIMHVMVYTSMDAYNDACDSAYYSEYMAEDIYPAAQYGVA